jgi:aspartate/tyrosine/aromatic aminotransferase
MLYVRSRLFAKTEQRHEHQSTSLSFSLYGESCGAEDILYYCQKNKKKVHRVFSSLSEPIKFSVQTGLPIYDRTALKIKILGSSSLKTIRIFMKSV